ncbi:biotin-dependent carboxyltransferase family protein [Companilactobacillus mishanensis]|uniref:5-oxoprolinase subunit C family protein n=1 Tax=Companilactobacillus mishanensis TaxID=2486008 RepID=UPI001295B853|nr:biotin-dependent carboxyltransferase family protein [Companilactobacillus mishanensis]MQS89738.1 biotin-dependent carboxyltransferase family protein [Companilactobacillus mishanensis]
MIDFVKILNPGLSTTIQDRGRTGHQIEGFPESGAMDRFSFRLANMLVNNPLSTAGLEFVLAGPTMKFSCDTFIAITGGKLKATLNNKPIEQNRAVQVSAGSILNVGQMTEGNYGYIAFANGGVTTRPVLDSCSTTLRTGMGGIDGTALQHGDNVPIIESVVMPSLNARKISLQPEQIQDVHFVEGPHWNMFSEVAHKQFSNQEYEISEQMDRMGYRLSGEPLETPEKSLLSEGTVFGNIQITRDGSPIVLMADRQTTGGYPVIGTVIAADLVDLIQTRPGAKFRFVKVSLDEAMDKLVAKRKILNDTFIKFYENRYDEPIGPIRRKSVRIEKLIKQSK